jgi:hypothetical protein
MAEIGSGNMTKSKSGERDGIQYALGTIAIASVIVVLLDGADALIYFGIVLGLTPVQLFKSMAIALMGREAMSAGWVAVVVGIGSHICVAAGVTTVYYLCSRKLRFLVSHPYLWGSAYGVAVFLAMRYAILPLTKSRMIPTTAPFWTSYLIDELFAHIFLVGIPIALIVRWRDKRSAA